MIEIADRIRREIDAERKMSFEELSCYMRAKLYGPKWSTPYPFKGSRQYFVDVAVEPPTLNPLASPITATTETAMWGVAQFTPIPAFEAVGGRVYELLAGGIFSTSTSGTLIITPRYGLVIGGVSLGPSVTQTVVVSLTAESWFMHAIMTIRAVGIAASTGTVTLNGFWQGGGAAATAASGIDISFGGLVPTTCDTSTAQGLWMGWTLSVAGSCTPQQVIWRRMN